MVRRNKHKGDDTLHDDERYVLVNYLIADTVEAKFKSEPARVCAEAGGAWLDGSVWILTAAAAALVEAHKKEWSEAGIGIWFTPFDPKEKKRIRSLVRECLQRELEDWRESVQDMFETTRTRLADIEKLKGAEKSWGPVKRYFQERMRTFKKRLAQVRMAMTRFDLTGDVGKLVDAENNAFLASADADEFSVLRARETVRKAAKSGALTPEQRAFIEESLRSGVSHEKIVARLKEEGAVV